MKIQAVVSQMPKQRFLGHPDLVYSVDVTAYMQALKTLSQLAKLVNENPKHFCDTTKAMAYIVQLVEAGVVQQIQGRI